MAKPVLSDLDFQGSGRIINLLNGVNPQDAATVAQLNAAVEGLSWKDSVRVATQGNISLASPGATIDGVTMALNDRVLVRVQSTVSENGIYIWNGAAVPMTRALDGSTFAELEQAVTTVEEGTSAGATYRQTQVNGVIDTNDVIWTTFGQATPAASETTSGTVELASQAEVDAGTDTQRAITPAGLANYSGLLRKRSTLIGDGSATSITYTHNLNTRQVVVGVFQEGGTYDAVDCEIELTSVNSVTLKFNSAPAANSLRVNVIG